jgi:hypothetical protein
MRRYVVVGSLDHVTPGPLVVGLIEVGDDAPFSSERDEFLGLRPSELLDWIRRQPNHIAVSDALAARFRQFRHAVKPNSALSPDSPADLVLSRATDLAGLSAGRSRHDADLVDKKRIAYLLRLARGERAMSRLAAREVVPFDDADLREGVRAVHDILVPRVHMEVTVCGAVPPFAAGLGGKLVVAFLAHPEIVALGMTPAGSILQDVFDAGALASQLPNHGLLALTTKGLYPGHSALYNRAVVPGGNGPLRLIHIGDTHGSTTALLHDRTGRLAKLVVAAADPGRRVSLVYGTGGAKRQRSIQSASLSIGLPGDFAHAGIQRPIYGLRLVGNLEETIWAGADPDWRIDSALGPTAYSRRAIGIWRSRWLDVARRRLADKRRIAGVSASLDVEATAQ